jgi:hypothetical protein
MKFNFLKTFQFLFAALIVVMATGCLKDKDFDNNKYGINNPAGQPKGVLFQQSKVDADGVQIPNTFGLEGVSTPQSVETLVKIAADNAATRDVHVKIVLNSSLITGTGLTELSSTYYTIPTLDVVIPAGQKNVLFKVVIPNALIVDPSKVYALGFTIQSVDGDYTVAANSKDVVLGIAIKNQYDGSYHSTGYFYHPSSPRTLDEVKTLPTIDANTVSAYLGDLGTSGYISYLTVDPATNKVTIKAAPGAQGAPYTQFDGGLPTTNPGYTAKWDKSAQCNNTYDPATKTFYLRYGYVGGTGWRVTEEVLVKQ